MQLPPAISKGDIIAIVSPASPISEENLQTCIQNLEMLGFVAHFTEKVLLHTGYLAGNDQERAADFMHHIMNPEVKGIWASRGGFGCSRMIPFLDTKSIKNNPKAIIGYSDITFLINYIYTQTGIITFHGPVLREKWSPFSVMGLKNIFRALNHQAFHLELKLNDAYIYKQGIAQGHIIGGNLSVLISMLATEYENFPDKIILFIEDIGEKPYRIDRMLTQLLQSHVMKKVQAIIVGKFTQCEREDYNLTTSESWSLGEMMENTFKILNIPVVGNADIGHSVPQYTIPIGTYCLLDTYTQTLLFSDKK